MLAAAAMPAPSTKDIGAPVGRSIDRFGSWRIFCAGLILMATGALLPGWPGYLVAIRVLAPGMRLTFLTASAMMISAVLLVRRRHAPG